VFFKCKSKDELKMQSKILISFLLLLSISFVLSSPMVTCKKAMCKRHEGHGDDGRDVHRIFWFFILFHLYSRTQTEIGKYVNYSIVTIAKLSLMSGKQCSFSSAPFAFSEGSFHCRLRRIHVEFFEIFTSAMSLYFPIDL
jgi:hypothetical protein